MKVLKEFEFGSFGDRVKPHASRRDMKLKNEQAHKAGPKPRRGNGKRTPK